MKRILYSLLALVVMTCAAPIQCLAQQDPIKWSAPMNEYPTQWNPTNAPPSYYNPYGYTYPYGAYGYGYQGNQYPGNYQGYYHGSQAGNPYYGQ